MVFEKRMFLAGSWGRRPPGPGDEVVLLPTSGSPADSRCPMTDKIDFKKDLDGCGRSYRGHTVQHEPGPDTGPHVVRDQSVTSGPLRRSRSEGATRL